MAVSKKHQENDRIEALRSENKKLRKTIQVLRKRLSKFEKSLDLITNDNVEEPTQRLDSSRFKCIKCKGEDLGSIELFNYVYLICRNCGFKQKSEKK